MAISHGKPGRYPKSEAVRRFNLYILLAAVSLALYCFGWGYLCARFGFASWWTAGGAVALGAVGWGFDRLLRPTLDKLAKERIFHLRGAQVESLVGWLLNDLPDDWHVFHGLQLQNESDIDHVVVGPGGLFCISTKAQRGFIAQTSDGEHLLNNQPTDFVKQAQRQTMQLRDRLEALLGEMPFVRAVLAVPLAWVDFPGQRGTVWVLTQMDLVPSIEGSGSKLEKAEVRRIVDALEMLDGKGKEIYRRPERAA